MFIMKWYYKVCRHKENHKGLEHKRQEYKLNIDPGLAHCVLAQYNHRPNVHKGLGDGC